MELYAVFLDIFVLSCLFLATDEASVGPPDYSSSWLPMSAQSQVRAGVTVNHELGETPLLVDVHVKVLDGENEGFIFPAIGGVSRDDDLNEAYGGVTYLYNNVSIMASAPLPYNGFADGAAVYTGDGVHYTGPNTQTSYDVKVKFRAWLHSTLPPVDFHEEDIPVECSTNDDEVYIERFHDFGSYPGLVIVRTILSDGAYSGWISDSVDYVYDSADGFAFSTQSDKGMLEMYAWKAESETGVNAGYRFLGDGALSFKRSSDDVTCSYGGLMYGYSVDQIRLWIPTTEANGGMICLASYYGNGINTTSETEGKIRMFLWTTDIAVPTYTKDTIKDVCYHTHLLTP